MAVLEGDEAIEPEVIVRQITDPDYIMKVVSGLDKLKTNGHKAFYHAMLNQRGNEILKSKKPEYNTTEFFQNKLTDIINYIPTDEILRDLKEDLDAICEGKKGVGTNKAPDDMGLKVAHFYSGIIKNKQNRRCCSINR